MRPLRRSCVHLVLLTVFLLWTWVWLASRFSNVEEDRLPVNGLASLLVDTFDKTGKHWHKESDIVRVDAAAQKNCKSNLESARSSIQWAKDTCNKAEKKFRATFVSEPLMASVDRRPLILRKQAVHIEDEKRLPIFGCAFSTNTTVSNLGYVEVESFQVRDSSCAICFQFAARNQAAQFMIRVGDISGSTKCISGQTSLYQRFGVWQQQSRSSDSAYPWTVDCSLPNGIKELSCKNIGSNSNYRQDGIQTVYLNTNFSLMTKSKQLFHVLSQWPWDSLTSHDDDRASIYIRMKSRYFVPSHAKDMRVAYFQGPNYHAKTNNAGNFLVGTNEGISSNSPSADY